MRVVPWAVRTGQLSSHAAARLPPLSALPPLLSALPPLAGLPLRQERGKLRHLVRVRDRLGIGIGLGLGLGLGLR